MALFLILVGAISILMNSPNHGLQTLNLTIQLNPFSITRSMNGSDGVQSNIESNGAHPVPEPDIGQPFDLLVTCETQGFRMYIDDQNIGSYPYLHTPPDISPEVSVFTKNVFLFTIPKS